MSGPAAAPQIVDFSAVVAVINALPHAQVIDAIAAGFVSYSRGQVSVPQIQTPGGTLRQGYLWAIPRRRRGLPKSQSVAGPVHSTRSSCVARPRSQRRGAAAAKVGWWMRLMSSKRPSRRRQPTWPQLLSALTLQARPAAARLLRGTPGRAGMHQVRLRQRRRGLRHQGGRRPVG